MFLLLLSFCLKLTPFWRTSSGGTPSPKSVLQLGILDMIQLNCLPTNQPRSILCLQHLAIFSAPDTARKLQCRAGEQRKEIGGPCLSLNIFHPSTLLLNVLHMRGLASRTGLLLSQIWSSRAIRYLPQSGFVKWIALPTYCPID